MEVMGEVADARSLSGNLVYERGVGVVYGVHVFCFMISYEVMKMAYADKLSDSAWDRYVQGSLESAGALTTLLSQAGSSLMLGRLQPTVFLRAVETFWDDLIAVGPRYAWAGQTPQQLWEVPSTIHTELGLAGVPTTRLQPGCFTREGLKPFATYLHSS